MHNPTDGKSIDFITKLCGEFKKYNEIDPSQLDKFDVKRGLRNSDGSGVMAGLTLIGSVQGYIIRDGERVPTEGQLIYRGINVRDIVEGVRKESRFGFEEVCYLLFFGRLPDRTQLEEFNGILADCRELPPGFTEDMIIKAPSPDIMNKLARSVLALYSYDANPDDSSLHNVIRQSMELVAHFPVIVAHAYSVKRHYYNNESLYIHRTEPGLSTAENFLRLIRPDGQYTAEEARLLDLCLILHAEHGGGNNSAFACRVLSSSGTDTYSSIAAAVGSLKGPLHGGANIKVMEMFENIKRDVSDWADEDAILDYLEKIVRGEVSDRSGKIYGMGHAVYTLSDPRTGILKECARDLAVKRGFSEELDLMETVERLAPRAFANAKGSDKVISANVDFYSGLVYRMLGIATELYTPIFAIARVIGWAAHRVEELTTGGRIIRPAYKSLSPSLPYLPMDERK